MDSMTDRVYRELISMGYPQRFCRLIDASLDSDYTKKRMLGYLSRWEHPSMEEIADEMLAILAERDKFRDKKTDEYYNGKWNEFLNWRRQQQDEED